MSWAQSTIFRNSLEMNRSPAARHVYPEAPLPSPVAAWRAVGGRGKRFWGKESERLNDQGRKRQRLHQFLSESRRRQAAQDSAGWQGLLQEEKKPVENYLSEPAGADDNARPRLSRGGGQIE